MRYLNFSNITHFSTLMWDFRTQKKFKITKFRWIFKWSVEQVAMHAGKHFLLCMSNSLLVNLIAKILISKKLCSGRKPLSGWDFWNFSLPKTCPQHGHFTGEKISKFQNTHSLDIWSKPKKSPTSNLPSSEPNESLDGRCPCFNSTE